MPRSTWLPATNGVVLVWLAGTAIGAVVRLGAVISHGWTLWAFLVSGD